MEIADLEIERDVLALILRYPECYGEMDGQIKEHDFRHRLHHDIFRFMRQMADTKEEISVHLVAQKINRHNLKYEDKISSPLEYLESISLRPVAVRALKETVEALRIVSLRRELAVCGEEISHHMYTHPNAKAEQLVAEADRIYHKQIDLLSAITDEPVNIFESMAQLVEDRAQNPVENIGFETPYKKTHELYGSLLRPGNITTICSRSGSGKTTLMNDICYNVMQQTAVPVLHFDNGEMSLEELQMRAVARASGVPLYFIETGKWLERPEFIDKVRSVWKIIGNQKFYYRNVAGKTVEEMLSMIRRWHMREVGRGNYNMIFCLDYIKSTSEKSSIDRQEWEAIGRMVTKFKDFIVAELHIPMLTAVQSNRVGVVTNKNSAMVIDDESIFSGGDRTVFFSSHAFILRKKTHDELEQENNKYGTHKLINVKARHLGKNVEDAIKLVKTPEGRMRSNYINLDINNFKVEEKSDFATQVSEIKPLDITKTAKDNATL